MAHILEDYEPVAARIARFWADHPDGAIHSELVFDDGQRCVIKATVFADKSQTIPSAIDFAEEILTERGVNSTSRIENCSTSAQGRALAAFGYSPTDWKKKASREEMAKVNRMESAPLRRPDTNKPQAGSAARPLNGFITESQKEAIQKIAKRQNLDDLGLLEHLHRRFGDSTLVLEMLTKQQASELIGNWG